MEIRSFKTEIVNQNSLRILTLLCYMFRLMYTAIIKQKGTNEKLLYKTIYLFYNIYTCIETSTYTLQKLHYTVV
jgi:hypothetical protein